jgi:hypothetical protein
MVVSVSDEGEWTLHETWSARLAAVRLRYDSDRTAETKAEYLRVLMIFKDLVVNGIAPREQA